MEQQHSHMPGLRKESTDYGMGNRQTKDRLSLCNIDFFISYCRRKNASSPDETQDDIIDFLEEDEPNFSLGTAVHPWKILITDDDSNVHETTVLALNGVRIHGRPLEFLHAYSAKEAEELIVQNDDLSLILLDVVMETVDAGLELVKVVRGKLGKNDIRIILRTGQPGYAPEEKVSSQFAIDGYTTKSQLTRSLLISVLNDTLTNTKALSKHLPN